MPGKRATIATNLAHFAINADDVARGRRFYERVFGWRFESWGPPDFLIIATGTTPIHFMAAPLPDGLSLNGNVISGTPTAAGTTNVVITADNGTAPSSHLPDSPPG